jgi:hypothetical protein
VTKEAKLLAKQSEALAGENSVLDQYLANISQHIPSAENSQK